MDITTILLVVVGLVVLYVIATYNKFATIKTQLQASVQDIGNQLKRQADLIPNLEASVKGYLKHEKGIFTLLTSARQAVQKAVKENSSKAIEAASDQVSKIIPKLQILVESNPQMKGAEVVEKLMDELRDTADKLMYARRSLIDLTADFNMMLVTFPSNVVGQILGMKKEKGLRTPSEGEHLSVSDAETKSPKVDLD